MRWILALTFHVILCLWAARSWSQAVVAFTETYVNNQIDTSITASVGNEDTSFFLSVNDSAQIAVFIDYRATGRTTPGLTEAKGNWVQATTIAGDTLVTLVAAAKGWVLRRGTTDRIPGGSQVRYRLKALTNNGVTSPVLYGFTTK